MISWPEKIIPVIVENDKEGYILYVSNSGEFENDLIAVVLTDGGIIRHYRTDQVRVHANATMGINKKSNQQ